VAEPHPNFLYILKSPNSSSSRALDVLDDLMYKAISIGFAFFTIATILGAIWAAEA
jgi:ABC-type transport system involved in cytochrome c biogenesis permease subunit